MTIKYRHAYGTVLGDYLSKRRVEIAQKSAGANATAEDVEAMAATVAEEMCAAASLTAEEYVGIESGAKDPTPEQCDALAAVLAKHDVTVTGDDLRALMDEGQEEAVDAAAVAEAETLHAKALADSASALHAAEVAAADALTASDAAKVDSTELRQRLSAMEAKAVSDAPILEAGQRYRAERVQEMTRRVQLRHGGAEKVPASVTAALSGATLEQLELMAAIQGPDPLATPMCGKCAKESAVAFRSSVVDEKPPAGALHLVKQAGPVTSSHRYRAARKVEAAYVAEGRSPSMTEIAAEIDRKTDDEIMGLLANE